MAIGRISGPMLYPNLERQGQNLAIDTDLVYFDVNNRYVGINNTAPAYALDVTGNAHLGNIYIQGNTITTDPGKKLNLGSIDNVQITGGAANYVIYTDGAGNLTFGNLDTLSGLEGFTANYIQLGTNTVGSFSNAVALNGTTTVTDAIALINTNLGNVTANVSTLLTEVYSNANAASYLTVYSGNISAGNATITNSIRAASFIGNIKVDTIGSNATTVVQFTDTTAIGLPVGTATQYPSANIAGYFRFNSSTSVPEFYNGTSWVPVVNSITDQQIIPDGVSTNYTLNQTSTANGIIVSINGTLQRPGVAYTVSGTTITFAEIPGTSDVIDVRFIASAVTTSLDYEVVDTGNVAVGTAVTIVDSFSNASVRSAKYSISSTNAVDSQFSDVIVVQNGATVTVNTTSNVRTGTNFITYTANISNGTVHLLAQGSTSANQLRMQRIYFNV